MTSSFTYQQAGVDTEKAEGTVDAIAASARRTYSSSVLSGIGGFGALFALKDSLRGMEEPVLVSGTDGVGTKLLLALESGCLEGIGQDLVAMCANDILVYGARPLFFLDYFAQGQLEPSTLTRVVESIAQACASIDCALVGGETAEMPGLYQKGHFDLAGFCVGVVDKKKLIEGKAVLPGDAIIGLPSSGVHSNGFSLVRALLPSPLPSLESLLKPTRLYVNLILQLLKDQFSIKAMAHITGGGLVGNVPRVLPSGLCAELHSANWPLPQVFESIREWGAVSQEEMWRTFNMGIGFILVVDKNEASFLLKTLQQMGESAYLIGSIVKGSSDEPSCIIY